MTVKDIAEIIYNKNYVFQVVLPGTNFNHGKTTVSAALVNEPTIESYLEKIVRINRAKAMIVKLFTPNGSSYKNRGEHVIFLPEQQAVAPIATNTTTVATNALNGIEQQANNLLNKQKSSSMDTKDYIDYKVLQATHKTLEHQYDECKAKVKQLEGKIEDLHEENKRLIRENLTKEDKHAIALERVKLEAEKEGKEGLSGLMGELTSNPDMLKMVVGFLNPKHPMFQQTNDKQLALEGANEPKEIKYTEDAEANAVLNDIPRTLSQKEGKTIGEIYLLFQEFVNKPDVLAQAVKTFLPNI